MGFFPVSPKILGACSAHRPWACSAADGYCMKGLNHKPPFVADDRHVCCVSDITVRRKLGTPEIQGVVAMRVVYEAGNIIDAHLVRHALEHAGIPVFIRGEALLGGMGELPVCGMVAVCVPAACWPDACEVLGAMPFLAGARAVDARDADAGNPDVPADAGPWAVGAV